MTIKAYSWRLFRHHRTSGSEAHFLSLAYWREVMRKVIFTSWLSVSICVLLLLLTCSRLQAQQTSTVCQFNSGPAAGTTHDYAPLQGLPIGSSCQDGAGSTGVIIAKNPSSTSTVCQFNSGPAAGTIHDYAPLAGLPIGSSCQDGAGSTGVIIAKTPSSSAGAASSTSTVCQFNSGPRAGTTHDYAPLAGLPIGSSCQDGAGSTGVIIAKTPSSSAGAASSTSTICQFNSGPAAGTKHDYAPLAGLPIGSSCQDGAGSTGVIVSH
jgi:predicted hydrocarbon binding protein